MFSIDLIPVPFLFGLRTEIICNNRPFFDFLSLGEFPLKNHVYTNGSGWYSPKILTRLPVAGLGLVYRSIIIAPVFANRRNVLWMVFELGTNVPITLYRKDYVYALTSEAIVCALFV